LSDSRFQEELEKMFPYKKTQIEKCKSWNLSESAVKSVAQIGPGSSSSHLHRAGESESAEVSWRRPLDIKYRNYK
jgi:hypothetical protein